MDPFWTIVCISVAMFVGSFIAGLAPILCRLNSSQLKYIGAFGAGMLLSTATTLLIPEAFSVSLSDSNETESSTHHHQSTKKFGFFLTFGYIFMFLTDLIARRIGQTNSINQWVITIGLCIHAACDGIALGVSSFNQSHTFKFLIFIAIAIHKAPVAFGLSSILLEKGVKSAKIMKGHLMAFSLSSPLVATITYICGKASGLGIKENELVSPSAGPVLIVFSAGTFLYIATSHILPKSHDHEQSHRIVENDENERCIVPMEPKVSDLKIIMSTIVGCIIPQIINMFSSHEH